MGKFLVGLIMGMVLGILAVTANPDLPQELRVNLAGLTALVMRNAEEAADDLGNAAEDLANKNDQAAAKPPAETAPADGRDPDVRR